MEIRRLLFINLCAWKIILSVVILVLLLRPMTLFRENLSTKQAEHEFSYKFVTFHTYNHFCTLPPTSSHVNESEILETLNIPDGSLVSESLSTYGQCLLSYKKRHLADSSRCLCDVNPTYVTLICISFVSILVCLCQLLFCEMLKENQLCVAFFGSIFWLTAVAIAVTFHFVLRYDQVWLPESLHERYYFRRPVEWTSAVILSGICALISLVEFCSFDPTESMIENAMEPTDGYNCKRAIHHAVLFIHVRIVKVTLCGCNKDNAWSMESPPPRNQNRRIEGMERYHRRPKPKFLKSFP